MPVTLIEIHNADDFSEEIKFILSKADVFSGILEADINLRDLIFFFDRGSDFMQIYRSLNRIEDKLLLDNTVTDIFAARTVEDARERLHRENQLFHQDVVIREEITNDFFRLHQLIQNLQTEEVVTDPVWIDQESRGGRIENYAHNELAGGMVGYRRPVSHMQLLLESSPGNTYSRLDDHLPSAVLIRQVHGIYQQIICSALTHVELRYLSGKEEGFLELYRLARGKGNARRVQVLREIAQEFTAMKRLVELGLITQKDSLKAFYLKVYQKMNEIPEYRNWLSRLFSCTGLFGSRLKRILRRFNHDCHTRYPLVDFADREVVDRIVAAKRNVRYRYFALCAFAENETGLTIQRKVARRLLDDKCPITLEYFIDCNVLVNQGKIVFSFDIIITNPETTGHLYYREGLERYRRVGVNRLAHPQTGENSYVYRELKEEDYDVIEMYRLINLRRLASGNLLIDGRITEALTDEQLMLIVRLNPALLNPEPVDYLRILNFDHLADHIRDLNLFFDRINNIEYFREISAEFLKAVFLPKLARIICMDSIAEYNLRLYAVFERLDRRLDLLMEIPDEWLAFNRLPFLAVGITADNLPTFISNINALFEHLGGIHQLNQLPTAWLTIDLMPKLCRVICGANLDAHIHALRNLFERLGEDITLFVEIPESWLEYLNLPFLLHSVTAENYQVLVNRLDVLVCRVGSLDLFRRMPIEWMEVDFIKYLCDFIQPAIAYAQIKCLCNIFDCIKRLSQLRNLPVDFFQGNILKVLLANLKVGERFLEHNRMYLKRMISLYRQIRNPVIFKQIPSGWLTYERIYFTSIFLTRYSDEEIMKLIRLYHRVGEHYFNEISIRFLCINNMRVVWNLLGDQFSKRYLLRLSWLFTKTNGAIFRTNHELFFLLRRDLLAVILPVLSAKELMVHLQKIKVFYDQLNDELLFKNIPSDWLESNRVEQMAALLREYTPEAICQLIGLYQHLGDERFCMLPLEFLSIRVMRVVFAVLDREHAVDHIQLLSNLFLQTGVDIFINEAHMPREFLSFLFVEKIARVLLPERALEHLQKLKVLYDQLASPSAFLSMDLSWLTFSKLDCLLEANKITHFMRLSHSRIEREGAGAGAGASTLPATAEAGTRGSPQIWLAESIKIYLNKVSLFRKTPIPFDRFNLFLWLIRESSRLTEELKFFERCQAEGLPEALRRDKKLVARVGMFKKDNCVRVRDALRESMAEEMLSPRK